MAYTQAASVGARDRGQSLGVVGVQMVLCWLLDKAEGHREKGRSLVRLLSARSTTSGMWSVNILGLIRMLLNAISLDHSARYRTWEKQDLKTEPIQSK